MTGHAIAFPILILETEFGGDSNFNPDRCQGEYRSLAIGIYQLQATQFLRWNDAGGVGAQHRRRARFSTLAGPTNGGTLSVGMF
jgi:hypothetical protein